MAGDVLDTLGCDQYRAAIAERYDDPLGAPVDQDSSRVLRGLSISNVDPGQSRRLELVWDQPIGQTQDVVWKWPGRRGIENGGQAALPSGDEGGLNRLDRNLKLTDEGASCVERAPSPIDIGRQ